MPRRLLSAAKHWQAVQAPFEPSFCHTRTRSGDTVDHMPRLTVSDPLGCSVQSLYMLWLTWIYTNLQQYSEAKIYLGHPNPVLNYLTLHTSKSISTTPRSCWKEARCTFWYGGRGCDQGYKQPPYYHGTAPRNSSAY